MIIDREAIEKSLKTSKFMNKFVNWPCVVISISMIIHSYGWTDDTFLQILWPILLLANLGSVRMQTFKIKLQTEILEAQQKKISNLYGNK